MSAEAGLGTARRAAEAEGDLVAFCRREHPRLVGMLGLYCGDANVAEDLAQETLLRVCRDWQRVGALESPGGWARRVAMNLAISRHRRWKTQNEALARLAGRRGWSEPDTTDAIAVRRAVARLPENQRRALVLRYYGDLSVAETAEAMGCPEGTVKALTHRAMQGLRALGLEVTE